MDSSPIRVLLPAGDAFVPAFIEAATTYSARKQHAPAFAQAFIKLVQMGCACVNSAEPSSVDLTMSQTAKQASVTITGVQSTQTLSQASTAAFTSAAQAAGASASANTSASSVAFTLDLG